MHREMNMGTAVVRTVSSVALVAGLLALRFVSLGGHAIPGQIITVQRPLMGTIWNIEVVDHGRPDQAQAAIEKAYVELTAHRRADERMEACITDLAGEQCCR